MLTTVEVAQGADDEEVMRLARREGRILLTEDKDFGRLAYAEGMSGIGVILCAIRLGRGPSLLMTWSDWLRKAVRNW